MSESNPTIVIDGFLFELLNYYPDLLEKRSMLELRSSPYPLNPDNNFTRFKFYKSHSEGGFWRLCTRTSITDPTLYKGTIHYTQQSFVHMDLQIFINNCNLESITRKITDDGTIFCEYSELIKKHIDDTKRVIKIDVFVGSPYCGDQGYMPIEMLKDGMNRLSGLLEERFEVERYEYCCSHKSNIDKTYMSGSIYKVFLHDLKTGMNYLLYVYNYTISLFDTEDNRLDRVFENKIIPIMFTVADCNITEFGLYNYYVNSGLFVCKILDYKQYYRRRTLLESEREKLRKTGDNTKIYAFGEKYIYIGDIVDEMDFLQKIKNIIYTDIVSEVTKKYEQKYLKYKKKYLNLKKMLNN